MSLTGPLIDPIHQRLVDLEDALARVTEQRDAALGRVATLRGVLAPLLDEPMMYGGQTDPGVAAGTDYYVCKCCDWTTYLPERFGSIREIPTDHDPGCPVLIRDDLLGRSDG